MSGRSPARLRVRPPSLKQHGTHSRRALDLTKTVHLDWDGPLCGSGGAVQVSADESLVNCGKCKRILKVWRADLGVG